MMTFEQARAIVEDFPLPFHCATFTRLNDREALVEVFADADLVGITQQDTVNALDRIVARLAPREFHRVARGHSGQATIVLSDE